LVSNPIPDGDGFAVEGITRKSGNIRRMRIPLSLVHTLRKELAVDTQPDLLDWSARLRDQSTLSTRGIHESRWNGRKDLSCTRSYAAPQHPNRWVSGRSPEPSRSRCRSGKMCRYGAGGPLRRARGLWQGGEV